MKFSGQRKLGAPVNQINQDFYVSVTKFDHYPHESLMSDDESLKKIVGDEFSQQSKLVFNKN